MLTLFSIDWLLWEVDRYKSKFSTPLNAALEKNLYPYVSLSFCAGSYGIKRMTLTHLHSLRTGPSAWLKSILPTPAALPAVTGAAVPALHLCCWWGSPRGHTLLLGEELAQQAPGCPDTQRHAWCWLRWRRGCSAVMRGTMLVLIGLIIRLKVLYQSRQERKRRHCYKLAPSH